MNVPHFMLKEIHQQPDVIRHQLDRTISIGIPDRINILACGTSLNAGLIGQFLFEQIAQIPTQVRSSSESLSAPLLETPNTITIAITQSGETADTIAALQQVQSKRVAITNGIDSTITRFADHTIYTNAGEEKSVAATKTFTSQIVLFYKLAFQIAHENQKLSDREFASHLESLKQIPQQMEKLLNENTIVELAQTLKETRDLIILGSGINTAIALEGALKLKEATYTHAEGYAAGEFLHGPIALLDAEIPTLAIVTEDDSRIQKTIDRIRAHGNHVIEITAKSVPELFSPFLAVVALQLLAYHLATLRRIDVDRPRNIAKSLTT
ncbi:MAG: SIS domain-containing protein [Leptolyngbya sp. UWPOB_LEPTO1]|uniref:SIS domain-containing protein n=1 Tax=Leptolyngbya sp. UWPOB_LEPTO1 TaxID=2815653 RepID=UPI001AC36B6D|nr:SIS domain-containing protein [Leptolyngbya sp. UWPOB_LEPTO1]MBN8563015.1 SIS domain-containing protein [Leptolyngbya sp. UWPOB_LEPTO1]